MAVASTSGRLLQNCNRERETGLVVLSERSREEPS
jgi:hypothetical protein